MDEAAAVEEAAMGVADTAGKEHKKTLPMTAGSVLLCIKVRL